MVQKDSLGKEKTRTRVLEYVAKEHWGKHTRFLKIFVWPTILLIAAILLFAFGVFEWIANGINLLAGEVVTNQYQVLGLLFIVFWICICSFVWVPQIQNFKNKNLFEYRFYNDIVEKVKNRDQLPIFYKRLRLAVIISTLLALAISLLIFKSWKALVVCAAVILTSLISYWIGVLIFYYIVPFIIRVCLLIPVLISAVIETLVRLLFNCKAIVAWILNEFNIFSKKSETEDRWYNDAIKNMWRNIQLNLEISKMCRYNLSNVFKRAYKPFAKIISFAAGAFVMDQILPHVVETSNSFDFSNISLLFANVVLFFTSYSCALYIGYLFNPSLPFILEEKATKTLNEELDQLEDKPRYVVNSLESHSRRVTRWALLLIALSCALIGWGFDVLNNAVSINEVLISLFGSSNYIICSILLAVAGLIAALLWFASMQVKFIYKPDIIHGICMVGMFFFVLMLKIASANGDLANWFGNIYINPISIFLVFIGFIFGWFFLTFSWTLEGVKDKDPNAPRIINVRTVQGFALKREFPDPIFFRVPDSCPRWLKKILLWPPYHYQYRTVTLVSPKGEEDDIVLECIEKVDEFEEYFNKKHVKLEEIAFYTENKNTNS